MIDLSWWYQFFGTVAEIVITGAIPIVTPLLLMRLHIANTADNQTMFETVAMAAAGKMYIFAAAHAGGLASIDVHNAALDHAIAYFVAKAPGVMKAAGFTPETVGSAILARLGVLLATDPSVTAGAPLAQTAVLSGTGSAGASITDALLAGARRVAPPVPSTIGPVGQPVPISNAVARQFRVLANGMRLRLNVCPMPFSRGGAA